MYGLDPITRQCAYSTPCGWCTKWDKKCDKKIGCEKPKRGLRAKTEIFLDDTMDSELYAILDPTKPLPSGLIKEITK